MRLKEEAFIPMDLALYGHNVFPVLTLLTHPLHQRLDAINYRLSYLRFNGVLIQRTRQLEIFSPALDLVTYKHASMLHSDQGLNLRRRKSREMMLGELAANPADRSDNGCDKPLQLSNLAIDLLPRRTRIAGSELPHRLLKNTGRTNA